MSCPISFCHGVKQPIFCTIGICFNCINKLTDKRFNIKKMISRIIPISTICLCSNELKFGSRTSICKEYFIKHLENNKEVYLKRLEEVEKLIQKKIEVFDKLIDTKPREIWLENTKNLPINNEEDYEIWLNSYEKEKKKRIANMGKELKSYENECLIKYNILVYHSFDI